jgi:hypothetical protein
MRFSLLECPDCVIEWSFRAAYLTLPHPAYNTFGHMIITSSTFSCTMKNVVLNGMNSSDVASLNTYYWRISFNLRQSLLRLGLIWKMLQCTTFPNLTPGKHRCDFGKRAHLNLTHPWPAPRLVLQSAYPDLQMYNIEMYYIDYWETE